MVVLEQRRDRLRRHVNLPQVAASLEAMARPRCWTGGRIAPAPGAERVGGYLFAQPAGAP
jgi:hypothetical protein